MKLTEQISRIKTIMGLNENTILTEKLTDVEDDVNLLYDMYFKKSVDDVEETNIATYNKFPEARTDTSILKSPLSIKAHNLNPCEIIINTLSNHYNQITSLISLTVSKQALDYLHYFDGQILIAMEHIKPKQQQTLLYDLSEERIKGSIHHELTHWIDDTLNNYHIKKIVKKRTDNQAGENKNINTHYMERQAQIHNIKQVYNKNKNIWDEITFQELINRMPSFSFVDKLPPEEKTQWIKDTKKRMSREGILGKNMIN